MGPLMRFDLCYIGTQCRLKRVRSKCTDSTESAASIHEALGVDIDPDQVADF